jgi:hypothetical protein
MSAEVQQLMIFGPGLENPQSADRKAAPDEIRDYSGMESERFGG